MCLLSGKKCQPPVAFPPRKRLEPCWLTALTHWKGPTLVWRVCPHTIRFAWVSVLITIGTFHTLEGPGTPESLNAVLRRELDLCAAVVPVHIVSGIQSRYDSIDMHIIRENIQGEYSGLEHRCVPDAAESLKVVTRHQTQRLAKFAFDYAVSHQRKAIACIHKANILKKADGLFRDQF